MNKHDSTISSVFPEIWSKLFQWLCVLSPLSHWGSASFTNCWWCSHCCLVSSIWSICQICEWVDFGKKYVYRVYRCWQRRKYLEAIQFYNLSRFTRVTGGVGCICVSIKNPGENVVELVSKPIKISFYLIGKNFVGKKWHIFRQMTKLFIG